MASEAGATYTFIADLGSLAEAPADSILSRTMYKDDRVKAVLFAFAPGQELSEHTAATAAILHILSGQCVLTLGGETREASAGAWVYMPPRLPHSLHAKTAVQMLLLLLR
jgi:quercetin dioxygenase-like cupin family protein